MSRITRAKSETCLDFYFGLVIFMTSLYLDSHVDNVNRIVIIRKNRGCNVDVLRPQHN